MKRAACFAYLSVVGILTGPLGCAATSPAGVDALPDTSSARPVDAPGAGSAMSDTRQEPDSRELSPLDAPFATDTAALDQRASAAAPDGPSKSVDGTSDRDGAAAPRALLVGNVKTTGDPVLRKRLGELGFGVMSVLDTDPRPSGSFAVVLITESAESDNVGTKYTNSAWPIVTSENRLISRLGMSSAPFVVDRKLDRQTSINIVNSSSPLAAGLAGTVEVYLGPGTLDFAVALAPSAIVVATPTAAVPDAASKFVLFAYEKGAVMADGKPAPARRVAWFPEDEDVARMTVASWKIFDACIRWAAGQL